MGIHSPQDSPRSSGMVNAAEPLFKLVVLPPALDAPLQMKGL